MQPAYAIAVRGGYEKEWISKHMPEGISLIESHTNSPRKLGFLGPVDLLVLKVLPGEIP